MKRPKNKERKKKRKKERKTERNTPHCGETKYTFRPPTSSDRTEILHGGWSSER